MYHACARGHLDCARFLLSHCDWPEVGAAMDRQAAAQQGLIAAVRGAHLNVVEYILELEIDGRPVIGGFVCTVSLTLFTVYFMARE